MIWALALSVLLANAAGFTTPTKLLPVKDHPEFSDDKLLAGFETAAKRQLARFKTMDLNGTITLGGKKYPLRKAKDSLTAFLKIADTFKSCKRNHSVETCFNRLNTSMHKRFNVFVPDLQPGDPRYGEPLSSFFTGYATHPIIGTSKPTAQNPYPIYKKPAAQADLTLPRGQIDFHGGLAGKDLEIVYTSNRFELYMLHIEGGGHVTVNEGGKKKTFYLSFDGTNKQKFSWISKYMMSKGYISNLSGGAQRKFLRAHPELEEEIFSQNLSYVYFRVTATPPEGSDRVSLTPGRSVATDNTLYNFKGLLVYVEGQRAKEDGPYDLEEEDPAKIPYQPFTRFFIDQDTGGAITGKGRADIYFGEDEYSQYAATYQQAKGNIYFLLLK